MRQWTFRILKLPPRRGTYELKGVPGEWALSAVV
jgi:hypothetical protein